MSFRTSLSKEYGNSCLEDPDRTSKLLELNEDLQENVTRRDTYVGSTDEKKKES
jgi:hypothetical protein